MVIGLLGRIASRGRRSTEERREMKQQEETAAGAATVMDVMDEKEKEYDQANQSGGSNRSTATATTGGGDEGEKLSLSTSKILNLECEHGFALVLYIHHATDLDPATGTGEAIVEVSYNATANSSKRNLSANHDDEDGEEEMIEMKPTATTTTTDVRDELDVEDDDGDNDNNGSKNSLSGGDASIGGSDFQEEDTLRGVCPLEQPTSKGVAQVLTALGGIAGMTDVQSSYVFCTPAAHILNGFASWGVTSRILKFPLLPDVTLDLSVKVWQVVSGLRGARVPLGEAEWTLGFQDVEVGIAGLHDCELQLHDRIREVGPKLKLSWRLESLRGLESDQVEMRISKLPNRGHSYAHGGFMGASMSMMGDEKWRNILKELESPKVYKPCKSAWEEEGVDKKIKLMPLLENSPILCAYGLVRSQSIRMIANLTRDEAAGGDAAMSRVSITPFMGKEVEAVSPFLSSKSKGGLENSENLKGSFEESKSGGEMGSSPTSATSSSVELSSYRDLGGGGRVMDTTPRNNNKYNVSFLQLIATSESKAQMRWKLWTKRLLKIRRRWRFAIKAVIRQCRISMSWEKSQMGSRVNRYGYSPVPLEWDLWVSPSKPWSIAHATVDHGSPAALVQQAIFTSLGLKSCAGLLGSKHINQQGVPPVKWLTMFGEAINMAVNGSKEVPLALHADSTIEVLYELEVNLLSGADLVAMDITNTSDPYCKVYVKGDALYRRKEKSSVRFSTLNPQWRERLKVWPVDPKVDQGNLTLVIEVWDHDTTSGDDYMGQVEVPFSDLTLNGTTECYKYELVAKTEEERSLSSSMDAPSSSRKKRSDGANRESRLELGAKNIGVISFECTLQEKTVLTAAEEFGIPRHAFQSCMCMLSEPGGIFLDVKSAYSKPKHLSLFCTTLAGLGICVKAVCSFQPSQLRLPHHEGVPSPVEVVRFFHGLSGLENACDKGQIRPDEWVLFNGASFLVDPTKSESEGGSLAMAKVGSLDTMYVNRYQALAQTYDFNGGIYVQETDCCTTCIESLTLLVSQRPDIFPLGFAYGHVAGFSVSSINMRGRGFASQQIVEEFQARAELSSKVQKSIERGQHKEVSLSVAVSWLERLLYGSNFLYIYEQKLVLTMLGDIESDTSLSKVIANIGGIERIFLRFFEHYEATTPFTIHETGFNFNFTKKFCRFLRDRGVLERLSLEKKEKLAKFLISRAVYGFGVTYFYQKTGCRKSIHKYAKEGLACLLESCTKVEFDNIIRLVGGMDAALVMLNGKWKLSKSYARRMKAIEECHETFPIEPQYIADMTIQRASNVNKGMGRGSRNRHLDSQRSAFETGQAFKSAAKDTAIKTRKVLRKAGCCVFTGLYVAALTLATLSLYAWVFAIPRSIWPYWGKTWDKQRIKGIFIILGVLILSTGLTLGVGAICWLLIFRLPG